LCVSVRGVRIESGRGLPASDSQHNTHMNLTVALSPRDVCESLVAATRDEYNQTGELKTRAVFFHEGVMPLDPDNPPDSFQVIAGRTWTSAEMRAASAAQLRKMAAESAPVHGLFVIAQDIDGRAMAYAESAKGCWIGHAPVEPDGKGIGDMEYRPAVESDPFFRLLTPADGGAQ